MPGKLIPAPAAIMVFAVILLSCPASAAGDKAKHFGVSCLFGLTGESLLHYGTDMGPWKRISIGTAIGTIPGLVKEIADSGKSGNRFDVADLAADLAGAFVGAIIGNLANTALNIKAETNPRYRMWQIKLNFSFEP